MLQRPGRAATGRLPAEHQCHPQAPTVKITPDEGASKVSPEKKVVVAAAGARSTTSPSKPTASSSKASSTPTRPAGSPGPR
ncbi:hypothetical protein ACFQQB_60925 [Nonomuraea rubra]|uniref:hypothetical protein n=1 Tax=Nonomuraea rubra TaxID=46180 RepID=UPI00360E1955